MGKIFIAKLRVKFENSKIKLFPPFYFKNRFEINCYQLPLMVVSSESIEFKLKIAPIRTRSLRSVYIILFQLIWQRNSIFDKKKLKKAFKIFLKKIETKTYPSLYTLYNIHITEFNIHFYFYYSSTKI